MKYLYYTILVSAITITSCKNNETTAVQANPGNVIPFWQQTSPAVQGQSTQPSGIQNGNSGMATPTPAGINPPHGELNHRCDIAVGAPLNTAANTGTALQSVQTLPSPQNVTAKKVTLKGMNPPHGESNHRCDIAVGAPLNSKPTSSAVTTSASSGQETKEYTANQAVPPLLSTDTEKTPAGMNPAHGKAGHRCDIAVGAALPKS